MFFGIVKGDNVTKIGPQWGPKSSSFGPKAGSEGAPVPGGVFLVGRGTIWGPFWVPFGSFSGSVFGVLFGRRLGRLLGTSASGRLGSGEDQGRIGGG